MSQHLAFAFLLMFPVPLVAQDGLTLFQPFNGTTTYLIDTAGTVVESWPGVEAPGLSVYLLPDGDLVRTQKLIGAGGTGGGLQRLTYDGVEEWQFSFVTATLTPHHDVEVLPNGNVLMIVWEEVGVAEAIAQGHNPGPLGTGFRPDAIYEIAQTGPNTGGVVWEWHAWDHLVQDFDSGLPNYGVVADHPELINLNYGGFNDWLHMNGIDYNPELDQIALSVLNFREIWIIDHSTTTAEAASHSGGNSGKGGDLLYRYGNPSAYDRDTGADVIFYNCHDVQWIEPGKPGAGNLLVFNNGSNRPTGSWSSIDEWVPPVDGNGNYTLASGQPYGPAALSWTYFDIGNFFSAIMGGTERLESGNTLICDSTSGRLFEVTPSGSTVWSYVNPFAAGNNWVFKARRYSDCDSNAIYDAEEITNDGAPDANANGELDICEDPTNYCDATPNSTGQSATMGWSGSTSIVANDLDLAASQVPPAVAGVFAFGTAQGALPLGDGILCLTPPVGRLGITFTDGAGNASFDFDNQDPPPSAPPLTAGSTWYFTYWFRDTSGGPAGFNFSDGLEVLFTN